jgi:hypothetical protein
MTFHDKKVEYRVVLLIFFAGIIIKLSLQLLPQLLGGVGVVSGVFAYVIPLVARQFQQQPGRCLELPSTEGPGPPIGRMGHPLENTQPRVVWRGSLTEDSCFVALQQINEWEPYQAHWKSLSR